MNKTLITLNKLRGIHLDVNDFASMDRIDNAMTLQIEVMNLGFVMNEKLTSKIAKLTNDEFHVVARDLIAELRKTKGADVDYQPMYPNFPAQVANASEVELFLNAIRHYWTAGVWAPTYPKTMRNFAFENVKFIELGTVTRAEFHAIFTKIVGSNDSISEGDKRVVEWFLDSQPAHDLVYPDDIPFKENLAVLAALLLEKGKDVTPLISTATDVLRIVTHLNGGDVSLAGNTKFKSMPRAHRRMFTKALEKVATVEDIGRHRNKWIKLAHCLHVGDYSKSVYSMVGKVRNNEHIETFNGQVQKAIDGGRAAAAIDLLKTRPSEFARRLDSLMRKFTRSRTAIVSSFDEVVDQIPTRVLIQVLGNLNTRAEDKHQRIVFPKGKVQRAVVLEGEIKALPKKWVDVLKLSIAQGLTARFATQGDLGNVYVDPALKGCPVPSQMRSASEGLFSVARGTRLPFGDETKGTIRFFIYWVGQDIDLSATFHDEEFNTIERVSYTNLRSAKYNAHHSGDIVQAPNGASEFIDIDIASALEYGARYVAMNVLVYSGPNFSEHEKCYAGWMTRSAPDSNEIYDPKTVEQKIDVNGDSRRCVPVMFDLLTREAIWIDMDGVGDLGYGYGGNNVESNRASIEQTLNAIVNCTHKLSLEELFKLHGEGRGTLVEDKDEADTVFGLEGDVTPYDINAILADYVA